MRRIIGAGLLAVALVAWSAAGQDGPVTIKLKKGGAGTVTKETKTEKAENKVGISIMGTVQNKVEGGSSKFVYTDEVIEQPAGAKKPTKLKRTYETAELKTTMDQGNLDLAGKSVLIEKKGDKYEFSVGDKPLGGKAADVLGKEFNKKTDTDEEAFLPKKPVKVGDSWKPDLPALAKELGSEGMTVDVEKSKATATLKKVYKKGDATYGVIDVDLELVVTKVGGGGMEISLNDGSKLTLKIELDGCIDGTQSTGTSKMSMKGNLAGDVMGVALTIALTAENTGSSEEVKK